MYDILSLFRATRNAALPDYAQLVIECFYTDFYVQAHSSFGSGWNSTWLHGNRNTF